MSSVAIVFRKDKLNKKSEAPIHFRIIKDRKISYISSGIMLNEKYWDYKNIKVKAGYDNSARVNNYIRKKLSELNDQVLEQETHHKSLSVQNLKEKIYGKKPSDFFSFANATVQRYLRDGKVSTYDKTASIINKLLNYTKGKSLNFQDITPKYLEGYENYLRITHGNGTNTVFKDLKFIRQIFNEAYRQSIIEHHQIPFIQYPLKQEKTNRVYLTEAELNRIENLVLSGSNKLDIHRDMFVFAAYVGGLRVSDVLQLKWDFFDGAHINFTIRKTGQQLSIKLPNKAIEILSKYKKNKARQADFIFPMLPEGIDMNNPRAVDNAISSATAYINRNLKTIALLSKLTKPLSFHISRHTWATRALLKGISIDKVSKLMGHSAIQQTQVYAKIVSKELDNAMDVFNI